MTLPSDPGPQPSTADAVRYLEHRIATKPMIGIIMKWLSAGGMLSSNSGPHLGSPGVPSKQA